MIFQSQDNIKLLKQPQSGFKKLNHSNKYQWNVSTQTQNAYLDYLIGPNFKIKKTFSFIIQK